MEQPPCVCTHSHAVHEHYRRGRDCGICGPEVCMSYRPNHGSHRCQRSDDLEGELAVARNLLLFGRFAISRVGPLRPHRARQLRLLDAQMRRRLRRLPRPREAS